MPTVETVRGPVDSADLGKVLMHEHVFTLGTEIRQNYPHYPDPWDEDSRVDDGWRNCPRWSRGESIPLSTPP